MLTDKNFMNIAKEISLASKCVSKKVGCIIVKDGRILSTGYNGTPAGYKNCCDHWNNKWSEKHHEWSLKYEIHAEMNAIVWAARKGASVEGATLYCTMEPCSECTKNTIQAGITRIVFDTRYEHNNSEMLDQFINDCSIEKTQIIW